MMETAENPDFRDLAFVFACTQFSGFIQTARSMTHFYAQEICKPFSI